MYKLTTSTSSTNNRICFVHIGHTHTKWTEMKNANPKRKTNNFFRCNDNELTRERRRKNGSNKPIKCDIYLLFCFLFMCFELIPAKWTKHTNSHVYLLLSIVSVCGWLAWVYDCIVFSTLVLLLSKFVIFSNILWCAREANFFLLFVLMYFAIHTIRLKSSRPRIEMYIEIYSIKFRSKAATLRQVCL